MSRPYQALAAWNVGKELACDVHIACATYTCEHPDDLLRDMRREATLLPALVAEATVRSADEARDVLVDALAALVRMETICELVIDLGHLKADQLDDVNDGARAFRQAVEAMIKEYDADVR